MTSHAKPADTPWIVPYLVVKDADKSLDFYARAFGFVKRSAMAGEDGRIVHADMTYRDLVIMFAPEGGYGSAAKCPAALGAPSPVTLYVYCEDVDALCKRAEAAGAQVAMPPTDMFWGDRMCSLIDPDGHAWNFATHLGEQARP
jgi:PhnB protein